MDGLLDSTEADICYYVPIVINFFFNKTDPRQEHTIVHVPFEISFNVLWCPQQVTYEMTDTE